MSGKPYQSSLIPYEDEIIALRHRRPPMPYAQIAELLRQKHNLLIHRSAIFKFVKVGSAGRKVYSYSYSRNAPEKKAATAPAPQVTASGPHPPAVVAVTVKRSPSTIRFKFTPSDRNNAARLSPEQAAAIHRKLEQNGH